MTLHSEAVKEIDLEALRAALAVIQRETVRAGGVSFSDGRDLIATHAAVSAALAELTTRRARDAEVARLIACELARIDGYDPEDQRGELYGLRWSSGPNPEPLGDVWQMDYLPKGERIAAAILPFQRSGDKGDAT